MTSIFYSLILLMAIDMNAPDWFYAFMVIMWFIEHVFLALNRIIDKVIEQNQSGT